MPYIPREIFNRLVLAGAQMSNLCYNLRQDARIANRDREFLGQCQRVWDSAVSEARKQTAIRRKKTP